jgi:hypothetical protein
MSIQGCNEAGSRDLFDKVALEVVIGKLVKLRAAVRFAVLRMFRSANIIDSASCQMGAVCLPRVT